MAKKSKRVNKKHFPGDDPVDIHTGRTPKCYRGGACEYKNAGRSTTLPGGSQKIAQLSLGKAQDHHVIPVSVLIAYRGDRSVRPSYEGYIRYIDAMYRGQDYCANNADNLIWLPTKATYAQHSTGPSSAVFDLNLPCHTWGHPSYTKDVLVDAKSNIWNPIKESYADGKPCPDVNVVSIQFTRLQSKYGSFLRQKGSTRQGVENAGKTADWFHPFCMAKSDDASAEPAFNFAKSVNVPKALLRNV